MAIPSCLTQQYFKVKSSNILRTTAVELGIAAIQLGSRIVQYFKTKIFLPGNEEQMLTDSCPVGCF